MGTWRSEDRPAWARRLRAERTARAWSQRDAVRAMRRHSERALPSDEALLRNWKRWEAGEGAPDDFYRRLIARTLGTVTEALFPPAPGAARGDGDGQGEHPETLEIVSRLRASDVSPSTLEALHLTTDRLCSEYPYRAPEALRREARAWLGQVAALLDGRLTLTQHRELLVVAGWLTLLVGCLEHDLGERGRAETTRRAALSLGEEAGHADLVAWSHELLAWYALTQGDDRRAIAASRAGLQASRTTGVAVQLAAQAAKAWARRGDLREAEAALGHGRSLLDALPHPDNVSHHFVVDPDKFDFYAMDCYRSLGEDRRAEAYARQVIEAGMDASGRQRWPMRVAPAHVTLGVVAARGGDVEEAVARGERALAVARKSIPSLLLVSRELEAELVQRYPRHPEVRSYREHLHDLSSSGSG